MAADKNESFLAVYYQTQNLAIFRQIHIGPLIRINIALVGKFFSWLLDLFWTLLVHWFIIDYYLLPVVQYILGLHRISGRMPDKSKPNIWLLIRPDIRPNMQLGFNKHRPDTFYYWKRQMCNCSNMFTVWRKKCEYMKSATIHLWFFSKFLAYGNENSWKSGV